MIIIDCEQLTPEWFAEKAGNPGASSFDKIVTTTGARSKQRDGYLNQLAAEAVTGQIEDSYTNPAMQTGIDRQNESISAYETLFDVEVTKVGLVYPDEQKRYHCSPDGLIIKGVDKPRGTEHKNPMAKTHVGYLRAGVLPTEYKIQVQGSLLVTGYDRWDFFSYSPGLPPFIVQVERDEKFITKLREELDQFTMELAALIRKLREM